MRKLKILHVHDYYQQAGGEDTAFESEVMLLRQKGQDVLEYVEDNHRIVSMSQISAAFQTVWSWETHKKLSSFLAQNKPDLVHFHNIFPLISPSAYYACHELSIPVVQSLDNPRLICPTATFYRNGRLCQDCLGKTPPYPGVLHGCYHNSRSQTAVVAAMLTLHRWLKTWRNQVDLFLVATAFYRQKFIEGGLPSERVVVKPHFVHPDLGRRLADHNGNYALFIARLDPEKGVHTMLEAWRELPAIPLKVRGSGQLERESVTFIQRHRLNKVEIIGRLSRTELTRLIKNARFLIWPSEGYYETFGYAAVECFSAGVPVIASRIGVMSEIVKDGITGLYFIPGDSADLARKVKWAWEHPREMAEMGRNARREYEMKYTANRNYEMLMNIYQRTIESKRDKRN